MKDIRTWIFVFFLLRMYGIAFPPLEIGHNWRQTDGLMIARNFYERDANIFYPQTDVTNGNDGYVGSEFPILNYTVFLLAKVVGFHDWLGRLVVLITSCVGVYFFYKLILKRFGENVAFNAAIILTVSMWFSYSRKMMPDVFAASLAIIGLYYGYCFLKEGRRYTLFLFFLLATLGCLSKILAASILTVLIFPMLDRNILLPRKIVVALMSTITLACVYWWYFVWVPHLQLLGPASHFFMGYEYMEGLNLVLQNFVRIFELLFMAPIKYAGFVVFVGAIVITIRNKDWLPVWIFAVPMVAYLIIFVKTGSSIAFGDNYYVLTMIPSMAFIVGYALANLKWRKVALAAMIIVSVESIADQIYDFRVKQPFKALTTLEGVMDGVSKRSDLVAVFTDPENPTVMYMAHRRGWTSKQEQLLDAVYVNDIKSKGCKFVIITKATYADLILPYRQVHDSEYFRVYSLD